VDLVAVALLHCCWVRLVAQLVQIIGITHNPFLPGLLASPDGDPALHEAAADYALMRQKLAEAAPDLLVVIASDHLNQWFMDNMPAFIIGKGPRAEGPFPHEQRAFGVAPYRARVDSATARLLLEAGSQRGVDFAFSDEFLIDHAFTVPLNFLRPEMDLPIVPIWTNVMAPPIPASERFFAVGQAIRQAIEQLPDQRRVAVLSSGHLAVDVGGPKGYIGSSDKQFDERMMDLIARGECAQVIHGARFERLLESGNVTPGFMNYVLLLGLANGVPPTSTALRFPKVTPAVPYMEWSFS
jgi:protocatechuate 4,5-dioxygenase beta chain